MPMPDHVKADLRSKADEHDNQARGKQGDEAEFHRNLAQLLRHPNFEKALDDANDNGNDRSEARSNAKGYLQRKGVPGLEKFNIESYEGGWCWKYYWWLGMYVWTWCFSGW